MSKIVLVTSDFPPAFGGGISRYYHELCRALPYNTIVLAPVCADDQFDKIQPFKIVRLRVPLNRSLVGRVMQSFLFGIYSVLVFYNEKADLILFGHWYLAVMGFVLRIFGLRFGVFLHGGELDRFSKNSLIHHVAMKAFEQANIIVVNSEHTVNEYRANGGKNSRVVKIFPGVDVERFVPITTSNIRETLGLKGKQVLLTVSRVVERKGHDMVIKAMPSILQKIPQAVYLIAGTGPQEDYLKFLASEVGVAKQVVFIGYVAEDELPFYYNACDVFVMPSRQIGGREGIEGFGIVYLEASACGKPVIGGDSGGVPEAVQNGITGFLVDPNDYIVIANAIIKLLSDPDLSQRLGLQGRERVERDFAWGIQALRLRNALEDVLK